MFSFIKGNKISVEVVPLLPVLGTVACRGLSPTLALCRVLKWVCSEDPEKDMEEPVPWAEKPVSVQIGAAMEGQGPWTEYKPWLLSEI